MTKIIFGAGGQDGKVLKKISPDEDFIEIYSHQIANVDNRNNKNLRRDSVELIFANNRIEEVFFLASINSPAVADEDITTQLSLQNNSKLVFDDFIFCIEMVRKYAPEARIFFASSALIFGMPSNNYQDESQALNPVEFYSLFKVICHDVVKYYRDNKNIFISCGILFPHESEFRKSNYLFRQVFDHATSIWKGNKVSPLLVSDFQFTREWNCAYQTMKCVLELLKHKDPTDVVIGSGIQYSVEEFCNFTYRYFGLDYKQFVLQQKSEMIERSPNLAAKPDKLLKIIGYKPDGDLRALIDRTHKNLSARLV